MDKFYKISEQSLKQLIRDSIELSYLNNYGVDNWVGHVVVLRHMCDVDDVIYDELKRYKEI